MEKKSQNSQVYFEKQSFFSLQCGRHTVNNLLGDNVYSKQAMTEICYELSDDFINPHKHVFGGEFDVNVLMIALQRHKLQTRWHNRKEGQLKVPKIGQNKQVMGYLVNIYSGGGPTFVLKLCGISRRHWLAVRRVKDSYYWLDSKQQAPILRSSEQTQNELNRLIAQTQGGDQSSEVIEVLRE